MGTTLSFTPASHHKRGPFRCDPASPSPPRKLRTFVIERGRNEDRNLRRRVLRLIEREPEIFKRTSHDIRAYLDSGELICIFEILSTGARRLVGVAIYQLFDWHYQKQLHQIIEIGLTVIHKSRRKWGLSEIAASAVMVHALSQHDHLVAVLNTFRDTNTACQAANTRVYADVGGFLEFRLRFPKLTTFQVKRRLDYRNGHWVGHGRMALMTEGSFRAGLSAFWDAGTPRGYYLPKGHKVILGAGWDAPGFQDDLMALREGKRLPNVETWQQATPSMAGAA